MTIELSRAGKRFNQDWVFRNADLDFNQGVSYGIIGPNGSGKSTLLQCIGGLLQLSIGSIHYHSKEKQVRADKIYMHISFCAPYLDIIEEMTSYEFLQFHSTFKPFLHGLNSMEILKIIGLETAADKQLKDYSSGMKQRVKLAQSIFSETEVLLLDEPCTNLDTQGISLYKMLVEQYCREKIIIVSSNDKTEYSFCRELINVEDYKLSVQDLNN